MQESKSENTKKAKEPITDFDLEKAFAHLANNEKSRLEGIMQEVKDSNLTEDNLAQLGLLKDKGPNELLLLSQNLVQLMPELAEEYSGDRPVMENYCDVIMLLFSLIGPVEPVE